MGVCRPDTTYLNMWVN